MYKNELMLKAIELRTQERMSLGNIHKKLDVAKSTLSRWLRQYPLTLEEMREQNNKREYHHPRYFGDVLEQSKYHKMLNNRRLSKDEKGKIAESAILFRLVLNGYKVYSSVFDGDKYDWVVDSGKRLIKIQVKWALENKKTHNHKMIPIRCSNGRNKVRRLTEQEFDFIIGYDLYTDTAYIYSANELKNHKSVITCSKDAEERWDKII